MSLGTQTDSTALLEKWGYLLEDSALPPIRSLERKMVTARLLENTEEAFENGQFDQVNHPLMEAAPTTNTAGIKNYDPVLISLIRRTAPNLIAYDLVGVQALNGPTGQIFAMRSRYANQAGTEAFYNEANTGHSTIRGGNTSIVGDAALNVGSTPSGNAQAYNVAGGMSLAQAEALGSAGNSSFNEMSISIEQILVKAQSRALKAEYTTEMAQDLKSIHGLDAHRELANVLATELVSEINREIIRSIYVTAVTGSPTTRATTAGIVDLDTDTNGRWMAERFEGLLMHIDMETHDIAKATRRGKGNVMICSAYVASALRRAKVLDATTAAQLQVDDTGNTFAGVLDGNIRVYIDPYAAADFFVVGYKGASSWDAGMYYCPYTPLQMARAMGQDTFNPKIGFKTRYALAANPFSKGASASDGSLEANSNVYYRRSIVTNLM